MENAWPDFEEDPWCVGFSPLSRDLHPSRCRDPQQVLAEVTPIGIAPLSFRFRLRTAIVRWAERWVQAFSDLPDIFDI